MEQVEIIEMGNPSELTRRPPSYGMSIGMPTGDATYKNSHILLRFNDFRYPKIKNATLNIYSYEGRHGDECTLRIGIVTGSWNSSTNFGNTPNHTIIKETESHRGIGWWNIDVTNVLNTMLKEYPDSDSVILRWRSSVSYGRSGYNFYNMTYEDETRHPHLLVEYDYENKVLISTANGNLHSLKKTEGHTPVLTQISSPTEENYINHGIDLDSLENIDFSQTIKQREFEMEQDTENENIYTKTLDLSKIKINRASIKTN